MSDAGDVLWVLPPNFKAIIRGRSWLLRLEPVLAGARSAADYVVRVSFGTTLVASVVLVTATIFAILTASQSSDRDNRRCAPKTVSDTRWSMHLSPVALLPMHFFCKLSLHV